MAMNYGHVYVASVAFGAKDTQTVKAFLEADAHEGPSLDHRLQPLHRPRLRHGLRRGSAEARRAERHLAALPVRPEATGRPVNRRSASTRRVEKFRWRST